MPQSTTQQRDKQERLSLAQHLRDFGFNYSQIAPLINKTPTTVISWLNPEYNLRRQLSQKEYRNRDPHKRRKQCRDWYVQNAATERISSRNRQAEINGYVPADITPEQETWLRSQQRNCQLCGRHESEFKKGLATDHNHKTGQVRGRLCHGCNHKIAVLDFCDENAEYKRNADEYRTNHVRF